MNNKIQNLLTDPVDILTAITDTVTEANANYVEEKLMSAIKDVAMGVFPPNYAFVSSLNLGPPFYTSIMGAIGSGVEIIKILEQPSSENSAITTGGGFLMESPEKTFFNVFFNGNIQYGFFKNLTILYTSDKFIKNCKFENCIFLEVNSTSGKLDLQNSQIYNCELIMTGGQINLTNCSGFNNKYIASEVNVIDSGSLLLNTFEGVGTIDFSLNTTNELNIVIEGN